MSAAETANEELWGHVPAPADRYQGRQEHRPTGGGMAHTRYPFTGYNPLARPVPGLPCVARPRAHSCSASPDVCRDTSIDMFDTSLATTPAVTHTPPAGPPSSSPCPRASVSVRRRFCNALSRITREIPQNPDHR